MSKKKIILSVLGIMVAVTIVAIMLIGDVGQYLRGALYNIRPIYSECRIESKNYNSDNKADCENFHQKFQNNEFPDGEYTIFAKYVDKALANNVIPVVIEGKTLSCPFTEKGYTPKISVTNPKVAISTEQLKENQEVPVGDNGLIVQLNYDKDGEKYFYDTNICEAAFSAEIADNAKQKMGNALLDHNGFFNSRGRVNEILIQNAPYYVGEDGKNKKQFKPGNIYATINAIPGYSFKFVIPCSYDAPQVEIPSIETDQDTTITFKGLDTEYLTNCGSKLYLSFQNTNEKSDIQILRNLEIKNRESLPGYDLNLERLSRVTNTNTQFPISYKVSLHLRDRADVNTIVTLGSGVLTITGYTPEKTEENIETSENEAIEVPQTPQQTETITDISSETQKVPRVKVKNNSNLTDILETNLPEAENTLVISTFIDNQEETKDVPETTISDTSSTQDSFLEEVDTNINLPFLDQATNGENPPTDVDTPPDENVENPFIGTPGSIDGDNQDDTQDPTDNTSTNDDELIK